MFREGSRTGIKLEGETHVYAAMDTCNMAELYAHHRWYVAANAVVICCYDGDI